MHSFRAFAPITAGNQASGHWSLTPAGDDSYAADKSLKQEGTDFAIRLTFLPR
jgi:hypothetical protein